MKIRNIRHALAMQRPLLAAVSAAIASVALVAACGGGGGEAAAPAEPLASPLALKRSSNGELLAQVQRVLRDRPSSGIGFQIGSAMPPQTTVAGGAADASPQRSDTLLQEAGVDEADLLKSEGRHLYSVSRASDGQLRIAVHRRQADGSLAQLALLPLPSEDAADVGNQGLMLAADGRSGVVVSKRWRPLGPPESCSDLCPPTGLALLPRWMDSGVEVQRVAFDDGQPSAGDRLRIEGELVDSRRVGDRLVLVTRHRPVLAPDLLLPNATAAERDAAIARVTAREVLPTLRRNNGAAQPLVNESDCWIQPANASRTVEVTTVTLVDLRTSDLRNSSRCFIGGTETVYMTPNSLYLATTRFDQTADSTGVVFRSDTRTDIHKFAFDSAAGTLTYRASADVAGHLGWDATRRSWRLSEHDGVLRVLTYTGTTGWATPADATRSIAPAPSPATLTMLREQAGQSLLQTLSTLPNAQRPAALGKPGEQVYGVRFVGSQGYVVTFRQIDPLYVLDLSNPADPQSVGELELPGYSDHLVPVGPGLLFAVGRDATDRGVVQGVKVALIDVANPAAPREISSQVLGSVGSYSALDGARHGLNFMTVNGTARVALPMQWVVPGAMQWTSSLMRWDIDLAARRMSERPQMARSTRADYPDVESQRSLQIGDHVYYLRGGEITSQGW